MLFAFIGAVLVVFGGVYYLASSKDREATLQLKATPWADIGEAPTGVDIRLSGRLAFLEGKSLTAPMSGRKCAAWRILIEEEFREGQRDGEPSKWEKVVDEFEAMDFLLIDDTGCARVESTHLTLVAEYDATGGAELFLPAWAALKRPTHRRGCP